MPFLLLLLLPLAEIATFIVVGNAIGLLATLALVIASSLLGAVMLRDAGIATMLQLQRQRGNPSVILAEGGARMLAGLLLLIPGFLTDLAAILILIPALRHPVQRRFSGGAAPRGHQQAAPPDIIDGDFRRLDDSV